MLSLDRFRSRAELLWKKPQKPLGLVDDERSGLKGLFHRLSLIAELGHHLTFRLLGGSTSTSLYDSCSITLTRTTENISPFSYFSSPPKKPSQNRPLFPSFFDRNRRLKTDVHAHHHTKRRNLLPSAVTFELLNCRCASALPSLCVLCERGPPFRRECWNITRHRFRFVWPSTLFPSRLMANVNDARSLGHANQDGHGSLTAT